MMFQRRPMDRIGYNQLTVMVYYRMTLMWRGSALRYDWYDAKGRTLY